MNMKQETSTDTIGSSLKHLPIMGICGFSGAGKTTVIEAILPDLQEKGLRVAVVKHDCRNVKIDKPGKDSYRFYQAGADVYLLGGEEFHRLHGAGEDHLIKQLAELACGYDLVLVEGHGKTPVTKLWMLSENESQPPDDVQGIRHVFSRNYRKEPVFDYLINWLDQIWLKTPVWGCVLIGGQSRRMGGRAKHLLSHKDHKSWLENAVRLLTPFTERVIISGTGNIPEHLCQFTRLPDAPGVKGPLSGILSASRWQPGVSWLLLACDMPDVTEDSIKWLLKQRRPGVWGVVPTDGETNRFQPLLAYYDSRCGKLFEQLSVSGSLRIGNIAKEQKIATPAIPESIAGSWRNVNTPEELDG